jgi:hypothetical protein
MDIPERTGTSRRAEILLAAKNTLAEEVASKGYTYVGPGAERKFNLNRIRFNSVVTWLKEDGFVTHYLELEKPDSEDSEMILVKVLAPAGTSAQDAWHHRDKILKMWSDAQTAKN